MQTITSIKYLNSVFVCVEIFSHRTTKYTIKIFYEKYRIVANLSDTRKGGLIEKCNVTMPKKNNIP